MRYYEFTIINTYWVDDIFIDHALFAEGLCVLLKTDDTIEIINTVHDGIELLHTLSKTQPDIILLDINMPRLNGLEAANKIRMHYQLLKIIMLSTYNDEHLVQKAFEANAHGYLIKTTDKEELLFCIHEVMNGNKYFSNFKRKKEENIFEGHDNFLKQNNLTKREFEILQLIKQAFTNQQISEKLFLSIYTVETHRKNIMQKLKLNSPAALMKFIADNDL